MEDKELLKKIILDQDRTAYERNILKVCGFLSLDEQSIYHSLQREFLTAAHGLCGGHPDADRALAVFLPDYMSMEDAECEKIAVIEVKPLNKKFADELTHRDYLGALMNLGIERECIGDILTEADRCVLFVLRDMAEMIARELTRVKHTSVNCEILEQGTVDIVPKFEELKVNIASERVDAVLAAVYRISRQKAADVISAERVFLNGSTVTSAGKTLKEGDRVSVRGSGKFIYDGISGSSKKGRLFADIRKFA